MASPYERLNLYIQPKLHAYMVALAKKRQIPYSALYREAVLTYAKQARQEELDNPTPPRDELDG